MFDELSESQGCFNMQDSVSQLVATEALVRSCWLRFLGVGVGSVPDGFCKSGKNCQHQLFVVYLSTL